MEPTFRREKSLYLHWKPRILRGGSRFEEPSTSPHARAPRNPISSSAFLLVHIAEYLLGALFRTGPVVFRNGIVIMDRYYYDFYVDPRRYRLNLPSCLLRAGARIVPKPDLVICLDAPAEVLQERKQEVPLAETSRQREAYLGMVSSLENGRIVDASQPMNVVVDQLESLLLEYLTQRTHRRFGHRRRRRAEI